MTLQFIKLEKGDTAAINQMSALARSIVKEHFDPIIGSEQNDYMIGLFQTVDAISSQLQKGYQYYFVKSSEGESVGFLAFYPKENELYLSKFYLQKQYRGQGHSKAMLEHVMTHAKSNGLGYITLNVNRNNMAVEVYKRLGFVIIRNEKNDIGGGYFMDDYVMQYEI